MQREVQFPNDYGASVIDHGYGSDQGLYEVAVLYKGEIVYDTPLTDEGVIGWLDPAGVMRVMAEIAALPARLPGRQPTRRIR